jgi:hypothetical protein
MKSMSLEDGPARYDTMPEHESANLVIIAGYFRRQQLYWPFRHY